MRKSLLLFHSANAGALSTTRTAGLAFLGIRSGSKGDCKDRNRCTAARADRSAEIEQLGDDRCGGKQGAV